MEDKTKMNKWSIVIGLIGLTIIIASTIRWFFLYPDYSQLTIAVGVGVVFVGFAYIHETIKKIDEQIEKFNYREDEQKAEFDKALNLLDNYYYDKIEKIEAKIENGK